MYWRTPRALRPGRSRRIISRDLGRSHQTSKAGRIRDLPVQPVHAPRGCRRRTRHLERDPPEPRAAGSPRFPGATTESASSATATWCRSACRSSARPPSSGSSVRSRAAPCKFVLRGLAKFRRHLDPTTDAGCRCALLHSAWSANGVLAPGAGLQELGRNPDLLDLRRQLRDAGLRVLEFLGQKAFFADAELRFPLIEAMLTPPRRARRPAWRALLQPGRRGIQHRHSSSQPSRRGLISRWWASRWNGLGISCPIFGAPWSSSGSGWSTAVRGTASPPELPARLPDALRLVLEDAVQQAWEDAHSSRRSAAARPVPEDEVQPSGSVMTY